MEHLDLDTRIANAIEMINAYEDALLALANPGVATYYIHTGQGRQWVTHLDIKKINNLLDSLYLRLDRFNMLKQRNASFHLAPCY